jgi:signal peptidase I
MSQPRFDPKKFSAYKFKAKEALLNVLKPQRTKQILKQKKRFWLFDTLKVIIAAFIIALLIRTFIFQVFYIPTNSMEPTLRAGDRIIVNKLMYGITNPFWGADEAENLLFIFPNPFYKKHMPISYIRYIARFSKNPKRSDIIVFKSPTSAGEATKRVIGLPGDQVKIKSGIVHVNGKALKERYPVTRDRSDIGPVKVPAGSYFVLGDNRPASSDSRHWGAIQRNNIIGILAARIWPLNKARTFK